MQTVPTPIPSAPPLSFTRLLKPDVLVEKNAEPVVLKEEESTTTQSVLHSLASTNRLLITKRLRVKNVLFLRGKKNQFFVRTPDRKLVYTVQEENSWWVGYFCYGLRPLQLHVTDDLGRQVMRIDRPFACTARVFPCQLQHIQVFAPPGQKIGSVEQQWSAIRPIYLVKNADGEHIFWIRGPYITLSCFRDVQFDISRVDSGDPVGATNKRWQGLTHAMFFSPVIDRFGVAFDSTLSNEEKGLLLAATILMDYMYYDV
ncbi:hypothetical protein evm_010421 [Chilo suppressalis]|nr:hypothetical protein evm_010421 [Chilo suppressalis]